jgi:hypothetical protein
MASIRMPLSSEDASMDRIGARIYYLQSSISECAVRNQERKSLGG